MTTENVETTTETVLTAVTGVETEESNGAAVDAAPADTTTDVDAAAPADADGKTEEGSQTAADTYADFALPDGMTIDDLALTEAAPIFKDLGLTQEQAQTLVDTYAKQVQAGSQKQEDTFNQLMNDWRTQSQNDKEFGGEHFEENVKLAQNAINKYGTSELKQLLEEHGVGNHPEIVRFMVRIGHTLKEDVPGSTGSLSSPSQDRVTALYPNG